MRGYFFILVKPVIIFIYKNLTIQHRITFKRDEKLKSRKLIQHLFKEGKSFSHFPFRIIYIQLQKNNSHLQAAFSVSSKNFKKAVDRNRIKRIMREAYRLQKEFLKTELEKQDKNFAVFIIYTSRELPEFENISEKMGSVLQQLQEIIS